MPGRAKKMAIEKIRRKIDDIDSKIVKLLNERAGATLAIGRMKAKKKASVYVPEREAKVYGKLAAKNKGPMPNDSLKAIYREIMSSALNMEKPLEVAYLGPELTFTHMASMKKFGSSVAYKSCTNITDVFNEVEKERADYGVVPIENSIEGAVNHTLDMFMDSDLKICSEIFLEISHSLLSRETDKRKVKKIYSKAEVFGQCRVWLDTEMPRVQLVEVSSTARAAEIVSREKGCACIASETAAGRYGLKVLETAIEDSSHNVTRFLIIGQTIAMPTGDDRTSIMFSIKDSPGALHDMLVPFKRHGINLTKIESRPSKVRAWEYYFFVDMEGHCLKPKVAKALEELEKSAAYLKVLGSYPVGEKA